MSVGGAEGDVFSCKLVVSSSLVGGQGAAVCELRPGTPSGALVLVPVAVQQTAAPPAGQLVPPEDCS